MLIQILFWVMSVSCSHWFNLQFAHAATPVAAGCSDVMAHAADLNASEPIFGVEVAVHREKANQALLAARANLLNQDVKFTEGSYNGFFWLQISSVGESAANRFVNDLQKANGGGPGVVVFPYLFAVLPGAAAVYQSMAAAMTGLLPPLLGQSINPRFFSDERF